MKSKKAGDLKNKKGRRFFKYFLIGVLAVLIVIFLFYYLNKEELKFESDTLFLKTAVQQGSKSFNNIKIKNVNSDTRSFSVNVIGIEDFIFIDEPSFILEPDEEHNIKINIKTNEKGVFLGKLEISSEAVSTENRNSKNTGEVSSFEEEKSGNIVLSGQIVSGDTISSGKAIASKKIVKTIPIILEVQSKEVLFDTNINLFPKGIDISIGERLNAEIKIYDLANIKRSNVKLTYAIEDFDGRKIVSETENLVVDGKMDYSKTFDITDNMKLGGYVLMTILEYRDSVGTSTIYFNVVEKNKVVYSRELFMLITAFFGFIFLLFTFLFIYSLYSRDKLLKELRIQYRRELKKEREWIKERENESYRRLRGVAEKREYKKEVNKVARERKKYLKRIYNERVKEFKEIKKNKSLTDLKKYIAKWKERGYDTGILEKKYKMPQVNEIKKKVSEWKKGGYNTAVLERS